MQVRDQAASLKRALTIVLISAILGGGTMMTQISFGQLTCPTFTANYSCSSIGNNPCSSGGCYRVTNVFYCTDKQDAQVESQKVTNATANWKRCQTYTPIATTIGNTTSYVYKSCAENIQECGTTQNYQTAPDETGICQELDKCNASWTRSACASFNSDSCFTNP